MKSWYYIMIFVTVVLTVGWAIIFNVHKIEDIESETVVVQETKIANPRLERSFATQEKRKQEKESLNNENFEATYTSYGSNMGAPNAVLVNTSKWKTEQHDEIDFSFAYPDTAEVTKNINCYRVEYKKGFAVMILPVSGEGERCGARTGVADIPDDAYFTDKLIVHDVEYKFDGFRAVYEGNKQYEDGSSELDISYDFHHHTHLKPEHCDDEENCLIVGYGIYQQNLNAPIAEEEVSEIMDVLRAIVQSIK